MQEPRAEDLEDRAADGDIAAMTELGSRLVREGDLLGDEVERGIDWLERAAEQGGVDAMWDLSLLHSLGIGVPQNQDLSDGWYRAAIRADEAPTSFEGELFDHIVKGYRSRSSKNFAFGAAIIRLASTVAHSDGHYHVGENEAIVTFLASRLQLIDGEAIRLARLYDYLVRNPVAIDVSSERVRALQQLHPQDRERLARFIVSLAAADGILRGSEVIAMRRVFEAVDVPTNELYRFLEATFAGDLAWTRLPAEEISRHSTDVSATSDRLEGLDTTVDAEIDSLLRAFDSALF